MLILGIDLEHPARPHHGFLAEILSGFRPAVPPLPGQVMARILYRKIIYVHNASTNCADF